MIQSKATFFIRKILWEKFVSVVIPVFRWKKSVSRTIENENVSGNYNLGMKLCFLLTLVGIWGTAQFWLLVLRFPHLLLKMKLLIWFLHRRREKNG